MAEAKNQEKQGFFKRTATRIGKWFRDMRGELKKVTWPTRRQVIQNSIVVLLCILFVGIFIWVFDFVGNTIVQRIIALCNGG